MRYKNSFVLSLSVISTLSFLATTGLVNSVYANHAAPSAVETPREFELGDIAMIVRSNGSQNHARIIQVGNDSKPGEVQVQWTENGKDLLKWIDIKNLEVPKVNTTQSFLLGASDDLIPSEIDLSFPQAPSLEGLSVKDEKVLKDLYMMRYWVGYSTYAGAIDRVNHALGLAMLIENTDLREMIETFFFEKKAAIQKERAEKPVVIDPVQDKLLKLEKEKRAIARESARLAQQLKEKQAEIDRAKADQK
jgi:hypothetical protein